MRTNHHKHRRAVEERLQQIASWTESPAPMTRWVPLGHGKIAVVDAIDFNKISEMGVWHCSQFGYAVRFEGRKMIWMHRVILNPTGKLECDHIDGNRLNNRRENLRLCTKIQNQGNRWKPQRQNTSKYKGVHYCTRDRHYAAYGREGKKNRRLGTFKNQESAARAYDSWAIGYFGEFAKLNFPS